MTKEDLFSASGPDSYKWKALATVAMGTFMASIDVSITNIAFPALTSVFHTDISTVMWVALSYILVSISSMLVLGKLSDLIGRKTVYTAGMLLFTIGLLACSLASSVEQLIFFRCLQGLGAAMIVSCGAAIVTEAFPPDETGRGMGLLGISVSLGFIVGPVFGGVLLDWLDWRSIFYTRFPICLIVLALCQVLLKKDRLKRGSARLDLPGALTSSIGIFCFVFGITRVKDSGFASPNVYAWSVAGILLLAFFVWLERRAEDPIVDFSLFRNRTFRRAGLSLFVMFAAIPSPFLIMPFYLMEAMELPPSKVGFLLAVNSLANIVCGPISGSLSDRFGAERFEVMGAIASTSALFLMVFFDLETGLLSIVSALILSGVGSGMFQSPNSSLIMGSVPRDRLGSASAMLATMRQVGLTLGMALAGTIYASRMDIYQLDWMGKGVQVAEAARLSITTAFRDTLLPSVVFGGVAVLLSWPRRGKKRLH
jgi:EmrB/QacA subfamily drug resistance transporter